MPERGVRVGRDLARGLGDGVADAPFLFLFGIFAGIRGAEADEFAQRFGILTVNPAELMKDLVTYTSDRWVMPGRLMELAQKFMVAGLPERQREAMTLCYTLGLSNAEAATTMEISVKAYESLLVRAKKDIRARLEGTET